MIQKKILCNLSFAHLCLDQINFIYIQVAWQGNGKRNYNSKTCYKIMINQFFACELICYKFPFLEVIFA
jgi:hypothetical protein